jgi:hypothetical protein
MQVQISVYINKKLAEKLEREKNKSQAVREGLKLYFQKKKGDKRGDKNEK